MRAVSCHGQVRFAKTPHPPPSVCLVNPNSAISGPVFKEHVSEGIRPFIGSTMVVNAPSRKAVKDMLEKDVFVTEGIWDWDNVQILPFQTILRQPAQKTGAVL